MKHICLLIFGSFIIHNVIAQEWESSRPKDSTSSITKEALLHDLDEYKNSIASLHVHPFDYIKKREFSDRIDQLKTDGALYDADQLLIKLMQINALLRDEHTNIFFTPRDEFPFRCYWFEEGMYITATTQDNLKYLFSRIVAINNIPVEQVIDSISTILPDKNKAGIMAYVSTYLFDPFILHGLGISTSREKVTYTLVTTKNETVKITPSLTDRRYNKMLQGFDKTTYLRTSQKGNYWYQYVDTGNYIYFKYARCREDKKHPFREMEDQLIQDIEHYYPDKIIIDMRDNGGGKPRLLAHFIASLSRSAMNKKGKIYVLVGRKTFSAAILNTADLKTYTYAKVIGEETAGSVAHYGAIKYFYLPYTKLRVMYSTKYMITYENYEGSLRPDVLIPERFSDYTHGVDAALEYAINH